jgi:serine protease Do
VDTLMRVAAELISSRRHSGLSLGLVTRDKVTVHETKGPDRELVVDSVEPDSPAAKSGIQRGDIIRKVAGQEVTSRLELERQLLDQPGGESFAVELRRNGLDQQVKLALEPAQKSNQAALDLSWSKLGLKLSRAGNDSVVRTNQQLHGGLLVEDVRNEGAAARAGIQRGDILVGLHQWEMLTVENVAYVLTHPDLSTFTPLRFYIIRSGQVHRGWIQTLD